MRRERRPPKRWSEQFAEELRNRRYEGQTKLEDELEENERGDLLVERRSDTGTR